jgi:hypothetical protein
MLKTIDRQRRKELLKKFKEVRKKMEEGITVEYTPRDVAQFQRGCVD